MIVRALLVVMLCPLLCPSLAAAQIAIGKQPDPAAFYDAVSRARVKGRIPEAALLAMKPQPIDVAALKRAMAEQDWVEIGAYLYVDRHLGVTYNQDEPCQLDLQRLAADGQELHFSYNAACSAKRKGTINHTNFQNPSPVKAGLRQVGKEVYWEIVAYGSAELHRVVSFVDNVLVLDISRDGKARSKQVSFRVVRVAIPRAFEWAPGEPPKK